MAGAEQIERRRLVAEALVRRGHRIELHSAGRGERRLIRVRNPPHEPSVDCPRRDRRQHARPLRLGERRDRVAVRRAEPFDRQQHAPAAALAEIGPERTVEPRDRGPSRARQQRLRLGERAPFERAAADRAGERAVRRDHHARAGFARARALRLRDSHQRGRAVLGDRSARWSARCAISASCRVSRLHGAQDRLRRRRRVERHGHCPGLRLWIASAIAANTEIASISGGSPTALER